MNKFVMGFKLVFLAFAIAFLLSSCATSTSSSGSISSSTSPEMDSHLRSRLDAATEYLRKGNHRGARDHLQKALEYDRTAPEVYDLLALLYYKELEYDLAEENYRKAISMNRNFTRGYNNLGSFLYARGRYEEACKELKTASTDVDYIQRANVFYKLGLCHIKINKTEEAQADFQKVIALSPNAPQAYLELADLYFLQNNLVETKKYISYWNGLGGKPNAKSLWLEARIAQIEGERDARDSHGLALIKLFPKSEQALSYKRWEAGGFKQY